MIDISEDDEYEHEYRHRYRDISILVTFATCLESVDQRIDGGNDADPAKDKEEHEGEPASKERTRELMLAVVDHGVLARNRPGINARIWRARIIRVLSSGARCRWRGLKETRHGGCAEQLAGLKIPQLSAREKPILSRPLL